MRLPSTFFFLATAFASSASALPSSGLSYSKTVQGRDVTVTDADIANFRYFAQYSAATYCNSDAAAGAPVTCTNNGCDAVSANGVNVLISLDSDTSTNTAGYLALDHSRKAVVLALRGSTSIRNWITNLSFLWAACDFVKDCKLHTGFAKAWSQIQDSVVSTVADALAKNPGYGVIIAGHSLGGAVGTIGGAYLRRAGYPIQVYTYGSPRVGNQEFVQWVATQPGNVEFRVTHVDDPVPRLPPIFLGYRHVTPEYWLSTGDAKTVDYSPADVRVCEGFKNVQCSASTSGLDVDAHLFYLTSMQACGTSGLTLRQDTANSTISDAELEQRLSMFAQMDREFVAALDAGETVA